MFCPRAFGYDNLEKLAALVFLGFVNMLKICGGMNPPEIFSDLKPP